MLAKRLIKSNDAGGGGGCTNTVDLYNPFPDGGGIALYQLNGNATDVSGNYDGTASNVTYGTGVFGQCVSINKNDSNSAITTNLTPSNTFSFSCWFKMEDTSTDSIIFSSPYDFTSPTGKNVMYVTSGGVIGFGIYSGSGIFTTSTNINNGSWHHLVLVTNNANSHTIYLDGSLTSINNTSLNLNTLGNFAFGRSDTNAKPSILDQVRIFSRALRPYEVEALYTEEYCTPTIVPSEHFNTVTYTGNGGTQSVTGVGFETDLLWIKNRSNAAEHALQDTVRGINLTLRSSSTVAEFNGGYVSSVDSDGFTLGSSQSVNASSQTYVAWNFKAGGAAVATGGTNLTNRFVSANPEAGFSIMTYTGSGVDGEIEHGLNKAPELWFYKNRTNAKDWFTCTTVIDGSTKYGYLNTTAAFGSGAAQYTTDTVIAVNADGGTQLVNGNGNNYVLYGFHSVEGFSKIGSYVGTGASGNTVVTGFEPAMIIAKRTDAGSSNWFMWDNKRDTTNPNGTFLLPNDTNAENNLDAYGMNFLENGFTVNSSDPQLNASGGKYIYMAFAADPTTIEPSLEDSFNTVIYSGNGTTKDITNVGFQPDLIWVKNRLTAGENHLLSDVVSGFGKILFSNLTNAQVGSDNTYFSQLPNGFSINTDNGNISGTNNYVAWCWKGAEIPAINSNGSIKSVVSANPAAGFSIVSYTGNGISGSNVGHGLSNTPKMIIVKNRTSGSAQWAVYHSALGATQHILLNLTNAASTTGDWNNTEPTNSIFTFNDGLRTNTNSNNYIAYCFAEVAGFSKFGSYEGTGVVGQSITSLGFEPAFLIIKNIDDGTTAWRMWDNKRPVGALLAPSSSQEEQIVTSVRLDADGFTLQSVNTQWNNSGKTFIYMAFANQF